MSSPPLPDTSLTCGGYIGRVLVDGKNVPHYSIEVNEEKKESTCWIASEAGKPFSMLVDVTTEPIERRAKFFVDGLQVASYAVPLHNKRTVTADTAQISQTEVQELIFAGIDLTDDDSYLEASKASKTGEIKIIVEKVTLTKGDIGRLATYSLSDTNKLHERSKKGLDHQAKLGDKRSRAFPGAVAYISKYLSTEATFIIRYRPLEMLQANGLTSNDLETESLSQDTQVGTSSSPKSEKRKRTGGSVGVTAESDDDEVVDITLEEEERRLVERLSVVRQKRRRIGAEKSVKEEEKTHFIPGEIIDLT